MNDSQYALNTFLFHFKSSPFSTASSEKPFVTLELGPGDSIFTGLITWAFGGRKTYLVDSGRFAVEKMEPYQNMAHFLRQKGYNIPDIKRVKNIDEIRKICNIAYLTDGLRSLRQIPSHSVDFIFSNAVLEHVFLFELKKIVKEFRRIIKPGGYCSHEIDLRDHLGGKLNHLNVSTAFWETKFWKNHGIYTNRLRYNDYIDIFKNLGFKVQALHRFIWPIPPIDRKWMQNDFKHYSDKDLSVSHFQVSMVPYSEQKKADTNLSR